MVRKRGGNRRKKEESWGNDGGRWNEMISWRKNRNCRNKKERDRWYWDEG